VTEQQSAVRPQEFSYPPMQTTGLIGRFGGMDLAFFAAAVGVLVWGLNLLPQWGYLIAAAVVSLLLAVIPLPRPGGRGLTQYIGPAIGAVQDKLTGRGVYRGAVFAPGAMEYRMDLPGDLAGLRMIEVPTQDGISRIGLLIDESKRSRTATAAMLTFGESMVTADEATRSQRLDGWESIMNAWCQRGSGVSRFQLMIRTAPDVINDAARHVHANGLITKGVVWENTRALITGPATKAARHEVYLVVELDLQRLAGAVESVDKKWSDEAIGAAARDLLVEIQQSLQEEKITAPNTENGWLRPGQYAALIHTQFDPDSLPLHDMLASPDQDMDPRLAGPSASERNWKLYRHDSGVSCTLWCNELPKTPVHSGWLRPVLTQTGVLRTVSLVSQPLNTQAATEQLRKQVDGAEGEKEHKRRRGVFVSSRVQREANAARDQEAAVSAGDGFFRYHLFVTVTAADEAALKRNVMSVQRRLTKAGCQAMVLYGEQDQAFFASALPLARGLAPLRGLQKI